MPNNDGLGTERMSRSSYKGPEKTVISPANVVINRTSKDEMILQTLD